MSNTLSIYVASKAARAFYWRQLRSLGHPIISSWIDHKGTTNAERAELAQRCIAEAARADFTLFYAHAPSERHKGSFVELGAALAAGKQVVSVGDDHLSHCFENHPNWTRLCSVGAALDYIYKQYHSGGCRHE